MDFTPIFLDELVWRLGRPPSWTTLTAEDRTQIGAALDEARAAWPHVHVDPADLAAFVAERIGGEATPASVSCLALRDIYLACGCCSLDPASVTAVAELAAPTIEDAVSKFHLTGFDAKDLVQEILQLVIYGASSQPGKLRSYRGEGSLRKWLKVVAVRHALNLRRRDLKLKEARERELIGVANAPDSQELMLLRQQYGMHFAPALKRAFKALDVRIRNVLRLYYQERLTGDEIGRLYRVHRTTISRWIACAHKDLIARTCEDLAGRVALRKSEIKSVLRMIRSQLEVSLRSVFSQGKDGADLPQTEDPRDRRRR